uniref:Actin-related protein 10 n=1 Tax=Angiostrongylus cantonensis TaxID=6313 RepID=A0A0K0CTX0_ANGCA
MSRTSHRVIVVPVCPWLLSSSNRFLTGIPAALIHLLRSLSRRVLRFSYLLTMPRERRVVIVENLLTPTSLRERICEALLVVLNVPSVLFIPSHLCATFPFNTENALVVDVGYAETLAIPVAEGVVMLSCWELSNIGAMKLEKKVRELLKEHGRVETCEGLCDISDEHWKIIEVTTTFVYLDTWMARLHLLWEFQYSFHFFGVLLVQPLWFPGVPRSA